uniref:U9-Hypotoxin-Hsp1a_1 n=1 Tax=Hypochilus sp. SGP-2016 TaxID=1905178 RepID=A0A482ZJA7_9ARAC
MKTAIILMIFVAMVASISAEQDEENEVSNIDNTDLAEESVRDCTAEGQRCGRPTDGYCCGMSWCNCHVGLEEVGRKVHKRCATVVPCPFSNL